MVQTNISAQALNRKNYLYGGTRGKSVFRCLSQSEWTKYLTNGDCAGCITKQDNNVWHSVNGNVVQYTYNIGIAPQSNITISQYVEILQNVKSSTVRIALFLSGRAYDANNLVYYYSYIGKTDRVSHQYLPIYVDVSGTNIKYTSVKFNSQVNYYNNYFSFRPAMEYIDNPHSKNIWY